MATADEYAAWIVKNADKKGTPDFDVVAKAYQDAKSGAVTSPTVSKPVDPTDGMSTTDKMLAGVGKAFYDVGRGVGQKLGLVSQKDIDESRKLDAPLMNTTSGKVGNIVGNAIPAVAAAFVPGGQTLTGSIASGAVLGGLQPTATGESSINNALMGGGGGALGYGVGKGINALANRSTTNAATAAAANSSKDSVAAAGRDAGYVVPPVQTNPSLVNRTLEGLAGKLSTGQSASIKNQSVTNGLAAKELGLPTDAPITREALGSLRADAGKAYDALSGIGQINADKAYLQKIVDLNKSNTALQKDFPELANGSIQKLTDSLGQGQFDSSSVVEALKQLRFNGNANKISLDPSNKALGRVQLQAADALEGLVDRNLQQSGQSDLLAQFRDARQLIAKTYSVEKSLNDSTGNVVAGKLAKQLEKGKPLSGGLKQIAEFSQSFPTAAKEVTSSMPGISPLDYFGGAGISAATGNPLGMLSIAARPAARSLILSKPYQNIMGAPSYQSSGVLNALSSPTGRAAIQAAGQLSPQLLKQ